MRHSCVACLGLAVSLITTGAAAGADVAQNRTVLGVKACSDCHKNECENWEKSEHFKSFRNIGQRRAAIKGILDAVGVKTTIKTTRECTVCHFTMEADPSSTAAPAMVAKAGPSCESCHGAASGWLPIHYDYGGKDVKKDAETAEHRSKRIADCLAAGMIWSTQLHFETAVNCVRCHGMSRPDVDAGKLARMVTGGHPVNAEFEILRYYQDRIATKEWSERSPADLASIFIAGQAAKWISAKEAIAKSEDAKYKEAQVKRAANAEAVLSALKGIPEADTLLSTPSEDNARKLMEAVKGKDFYSQVSPFIKPRLSSTAH
ncbi:MAG: hypothetical protein HYU36_14880 [Planctomycetes bacterium]|nr:hypothetical protein [Planctomycetota bacterium]